MIFPVGLRVRSQVAVYCERNHSSVSDRLQAARPARNHTHSLFVSLCDTHINTHTHTNTHTHKHQHHHHHQGQWIPMDSHLHSYRHTWTHTYTHIHTHPHKHRTHPLHSDTLYKPHLTSTAVV